MQNLFKFGLLDDGTINASETQWRTFENEEKLKYNNQGKTFNTSNTMDENYHFNIEKCESSNGSRPKDNISVLYVLNHMKVHYLSQSIFNFSAHHPMVAGIGVQDEDENYHVNIEKCESSKGPCPKENISVQYVLNGLKLSLQYRKMRKLRGPMLKGEYFCTMCDKRYKNQESISDHFEYFCSPSNSGWYKCPGRVSVSYALTKFLNEYEEENPLWHRCPSCREAFPSPSSLRLHIQIGCINASTLHAKQVQSMEARFNDFRKLVHPEPHLSPSYVGMQTVHRRRVPKPSDDLHGKYECPDCHKIYKWRQHLISHTRYECGKEPQFQCPFCSYRGHQRSTLKRHVIRVHKQ
ncbi:zinc finger protein 649-like [Ctenocephalides felis]|uniref:zinc finger protein 649-like n=1 Tax=Ctenocephalides felis TaxID=7515 RepID=UPI000E6E15E3|nr:zinc finger protein 649-like [Ctenocephalides felis]